jgi:hypothetical protein
VKPGDHVRATRGENVVVGVLVADHETAATLDIDTRAGRCYLDARAWHVEVIAPPLPPEPPVGSVVHLDQQDWPVAATRLPDGRWAVTGLGAALAWEDVVRYGPPTLLILATQVVEDVRSLAEGPLICDHWANFLAVKYGVQP